MKGDQWCNSFEGCVPLSNLDGVELSKGVYELSLLQWKHSEPNICGPSHGEAKSGFLECSPLSRWDPFEQRELEVTRAIDEGEILGLEVKNSKWVVSLMKSFCKIVGFPIVKHADQCLALFRLLFDNSMKVIKFLQTTFLISSFSFSIKYYKRKLKSLLYSCFFILYLFSIFSLFYLPN